MSDDFYAALGAAGAIAWSIALRPGRPTWRFTALAGAALALAVLTRSSGIVLVLVSVAFGLARRGTGRRTAATAALAALALAPAAAWSVRTSLLEGRPVFVHSLVYYNFWIGEGIDRHGTGDPPAGNWGRIVAETYEHAGFDTGGAPRWYTTLAPREVARLETALAAAAATRIRTDPAGYGLRVARGIARFWFQATTARRSAQYLAAVLPVLVVAAVGAVAVLRRSAEAPPDDLGRLFLAILLAHNLAYAAVLPVARMSVQVYPELAYLAAAGIAVAVHRTRAT
jgi:hypothetical protein